MGVLKLLLAWLMRDRVERCTLADPFDTYACQRIDSTTFTLNQREFQVGSWVVKPEHSEYATAMTAQEFGDFRDACTRWRELGGTVALGERGA